MANGIFGSYTKEEINADPSILNGRTIHGSSIRNHMLYRLRMENMTLTNTTLNGITFPEFYFKNVIFENCSFINCEFYEGALEEVIFKGGLMSNSSRRERAYRHDWYLVNVNKIVLDGVSMRGVRLMGIGNGSLTFKNMGDFRDYENGGAILNGGKLRLRIDNCQLDGENSGIQLCKIGSSDDQDCTIYATNSKFTNGSGLSGSKGKFYIDNCEFTGRASLGYPQVMVVKNSILDIEETDQGDLYFVNNKYLTRTGRYGVAVQSAVNGKNVYFINDDTAMKSADGSENTNFLAIYIGGGGVNISNADVHKPTIMGDIDYINLRNVRILGGRWHNLNLKGGHWENVELYPDIEITGAPPQFGDDVKFCNVTTPQGSPFNTPVQFTVTESRQPFAWPEVHVPTLQEMGIDPD
jgi:uncharacterized protein YjbI with pentapeptide repeats